ncbi:MAG TPA: hydrogenase 4 membrane subunit [Candidatus Rubneribacter avistercoris]|nr:hydrogenase 4 membrane subunit [Candidatus Rubneribacter avistercoris]
MNGYVIVNVLGGLLIVTSLLVVLSRTPRKAAFVYAAQSVLLVSIFVALGFVTGSDELFTWSIAAFFTKVLFVPGVLLFALKKMGNPEQDLPSVVNPLVSMLLVAVEVLICFVAVQGIALPTAEEVKPALAISLAHFFIGLTCIVTQRNILKQVFGYCLMENGSHVTLALLAPQAPELVEVGIATDAIFAVVIMAVVALRIYRKTQSLDADELMELKG